MLENQKSLVVKGSGGGGLGDRIKSVLTGVCYAKLSGRELFIDWNDGVYAPRGTNAFGVLFELKNVDALVALPAGSVFPPAWRNRVDETMHNVWTQDGHAQWDRNQAIEHYSFDLSKLDYEEDVLVMWDFDQFLKLQKFLDSDLSQSNLDFAQSTLSELLQKHLQPSDELRGVIENFVETQFNNRKTIGVHIRASNEYQNQKGQTEVQQYINAVSSIKTREPNALVFLATDNEAIIDAVSAAHSGTVTREKWFALSGQSLHLNADCPDILQNAKDAVIEMFLLARCDYLIRPAASSFSAISELASSAPPDKKIRLQPKVALTSRVANKIRHIISE